MSRRNKTKLVNVYKEYLTAKKKQTVLGFFRAFMSEIIFRTTKLEGEPITRKMVSAYSNNVKI